MVDVNKFIAAATEAEDLTKNQSSDFKPPVEGITFLRLRDYIELGKHKSKNPTYKPAYRVMLVFELLHPKHAIETENGKVPHTIRVSMNKGTTAKSGYKKLFNAMNRACGGGNTHIAQMINKPMLGEVVHNKVGEGSEEQVFANLDVDGAWTFKPPVQVDAITEETKTIPVPELHGKPRIFLWENNQLEESDIKEMWDSIFVEGEVTLGEGDNAKTVSKNRLQETIMENTEWEGSRTQAVVEGAIEVVGDGGADFAQLAENASTEESNAIDDY